MQGLDGPGRPVQAPLDPGEVLGGPAAAGGGGVPLAPDGARPVRGEGDAPAARRRRAAKNLARIERRLDRATGAVEALHARLEEVSADPSRAGELARLGRDLAAARAEYEELETAWLEAAQALEEA